MDGVFFYMHLPLLKAGNLKGYSPVSPRQPLYMLDLKLMSPPGAFLHVSEKFVAHFFHDILRNPDMRVFYNNSGEF